MTIQEEQPDGIDPKDESLPREIPILNGSPWKDRIEFGRQLQAATLESLRLEVEGELFRWKSDNIFGDEISIVFENLPKHENFGPHAVIHMTRAEQKEEIEINTVGVRINQNQKPLGDNMILDVGDDDQITTFIEMCARALEIGIPPDGIIEAAAEASRSYLRRQDIIRVDPRDRDLRRKANYDFKLREFSRQLSERQFL